jgi:hypothetical protein
VSARRAWLWASALLLVVGLGRQIAYGLSDAPLAQRLASQGGGTSPALVAAISLGLAAAAAAVGLWLVATGLRERSRLQMDGWAAGSNPIRPGRLLRRWLQLSAVSALVFTSFESILHYRAGLGFHAYHCLFGPVHQDALPILVALSLLVVAAVTAAEAVLAAARRMVARILRARVAVPVPSARHARLPDSAPGGRPAAGGRRTRGPPLPA